ncbi:MAG TPA: phospholipid carrier-dependent glycosyltransferase [Candidatus Limnocylindrales bacterium]|nr:phospholipid carrier-dependent glycosyltransferase [Candidatus Limnocylindrales bacterium]
METSTREAPGRSVAWQLPAILIGGLVVRLIMAYGIEGLRGSGFGTDLELFRYWATNLGEQGPFGFYERGFFADYTPGYLYALWLVGIVGNAFGGVGDLIKLPAIITDVVLAYVVYRMVLDLGVTAGRARLAALVVILNPITWFDSVIWGQVDSFGTVFLLLAVRELWKDRPERAAILAVVAALVKPQLAILVPIVAFVTIRRALWPAGGYGDEDPPPRTGFGWERRTRGAIRIISTGVAGFVTAVALSAPFGLSVVSVSTTAPYLESTLLRLVFSTAATYSSVTVNAFNLWALFPSPEDGRSLASGGGWIPDAPVPDATSWAQMGPFPAVVVGGTLLGLLLFVVVPALVARRPDRLTILVGVCALALAFFAVPTRVHERYLYPLFGLAAILFAFSWRWRSLYLVASLATFLNMYAVLVQMYGYMNPGISDWLGIGPASVSFGGVALVAILHTGALVFGLLQLRDGARRTLARERAEALEPARAAAEGGGIPVAGQPPGADEPRREDPVPVPAAGTAAAAAEVVPPLAAGAAAGTGAGTLALAAPRRVPAWFDRPSWSEAGPIGWLRTRIGETPIRPDRSRLLRGEGGGRLGRLDIWILIVLVVAGMGLRTFRLGEPARMHFDEVYHARTATEFLQVWRYGLDQSIYEWTHPHLAKYAMAAGIVLFAGHDTTSTSELGTAVTDAAIEPRRLHDDDSRAGERLWVATGDGVVAFDLHTRARVAELDVAGATAVAFDTGGLQLWIGTAAGGILALDGTLVDEALADANGTDGADGGPVLEPTPVADIGTPISQLAVFDDGGAVAAQAGPDTLVVVDPATGQERSRVTIAGIGEMTAAGTDDALVANPVEVGDIDAVAAELVAVLGGDEAAYREQLARDGDAAPLDVVLDEDARTNLDDAIGAGRLPGLSIQPVGRLGVASAGGVTFVSSGGTLQDTVELPGPATSVALVTGVDEGSQLYATTADEDGNPSVAIIHVIGDGAKDGPALDETFRIPGAGERIVFDTASELVEVLGATPEGGGSTIYVIEPHGRSVFADHRLPFTPSAWVLDHDEDFPTDSRGEIVAMSPTGAAASADVGSYHFSWRLPGVILGALTIAVLYLLARVLFARQAVAVLVGLFVLLDGMFFVQSRIAMNDVYTGFFILAAYLLFAWLWISRRGWTTFLLVMPAIGLLLGLALASKWVAAYAIGALGILVLVRSALGRIILIAGLVVLTGVLGWMAMAVPSDSTLTGNLLFPMIMIALTLAAVVVTVYHPIAWSDEEIRLAVGGPALLGMLVVLGAIALGIADEEIAFGPLLVNPLTLGFALVVTGGVAYAAFGIAGRFGIGPMAKAPLPGEARALAEPAAPPAEGWLRLGSGVGLPIAWMVVCLLAIPLAVYVAFYVPWAFIDNHQLIEGWPEGNTGQTLLALTGEMYRYHNNLTTAHAASSPWWAWPLNLKPVWFYQGSYAGDTAASIYDAGNMVIWWLGIPAMIFVAWQAFKRRSLALALVLIAFLAQWVSWARIDRAAFQYHYYTSLPFVVIALGYLMAELWHGATRRTWLLARVAATLALMGPVILWLLRVPLCTIANVESVNAGSQACSGSAGDLGTTLAAAWIGVALIAVIVLVVVLVTTLVQKRPDDRLTLRDLAPVPVIAGLLVSVVVAAGLLPTGEPILSIQQIVPEAFAALVGLPLLLVASQVITARDSRRFVLVAVGVVAAWFVFLYPNISALPLPSNLVNAYQLLLPTYPYPFQFGVNTVERGGAVTFADPRFALLMLFLVAACVVVAYSARTWRLAAAEDAARAGARGAGGPAGEPGTA